MVATALQQCGHPLYVAPPPRIVRRGADGVQGAPAACCAMRYRLLPLLCGFGR